MMKVLVSMNDYRHGWSYRHGGMFFGVARLGVHVYLMHECFVPLKPVDKKLFPDLTFCAETLFGFIAQCLKDFAPECVGAATPTDLGFTFSFPVENTSIRQGL